MFHLLDSQNATWSDKIKFQEKLKVDN